MLFNILANTGEMMVKGTIAAGKIALGIAETLGETMINIFEKEEKENNKTYEYFKGLSYQEQEDYFKNNEYLKEYMDRYYYPNNKELTAKNVQKIADSLNREFINKYNKY